MPEQLAYDHIITWTNPGDLVLDPFMGSGTTARMAIKADRKYIGFEIDQTYWELCQDITPQSTVFDALD
jgi:site-specific DNA-methyltransferase (adenine-specific)